MKMKTPSLTSLVLAVLLTEDLQEFMSDPNNSDRTLYFEARASHGGH